MMLRSADMSAMETGSLPLLENDVLRTFVAIAETGSFAKAAKSVFRTPSAVSMQIRKLEETLDRSVFVREGRSIRLTSEGEALLGYARRILRLSDEAVGLFRKPDIEGTVCIGTPDDFGTRFLPNILSRFARTHPAVDVDVTLAMSTELIDKLDDGELGLTLVTSAFGPKAMNRGRIVYTEPLVWAGLECGCAYEHRPLPLALAPQACAWRNTAMAALDKEGIPYRIAYSSPHCAGQLAAIYADLAIAPLPESLIQGPLQRLDERHGLPALGEYHIVLAIAPNPGSGTDALARHVVESFRDISRGGHSEARVESISEVAAS
jgi:DNA-binding transcriptional LysR family regulator